MKAKCATHDAQRATHRPSWDEYFMKIAKLVATRSTCIRRQVGAVVVKNKQMLATGYNGAPSGLVHCDQIGCLRAELKVPSGERHELCRALHAEQNAFLQAARHGISVAGSTIYITNQPCSICAKMIINAGVEKVIVEGDYPDKLAREFLDQAKIKLVVMGK
jgi:dCMP deaminase